MEEKCPLKKTEMGQKGECTAGRRCKKKNVDILDPDVYNSAEINKCLAQTKPNQNIKV